MKKAIRRVLIIGVIGALVVGTLPQQAGASSATGPISAERSVAALSGSSKGQTSSQVLPLRSSPFVPAARPIAPVPVGSSAGYSEGRSLELPGRRDRFSRTFANPDGSETWVASTEPVHFENADGSWSPIDNRVVPGDGGELTNAANDWHVSFGALASKGVVFDHPKGSFSWLAEGAADVVPVVEPDGESVRYPDVWPNVDVVYRVRSGSVSEELVLKSRFARPTFVFDVFGTELVPTADGSSLRPSGPLGDAGVSIGSLTVFNSRGAFADAAARPRMSRRTANGHQELTVGLDGDWLRGVPEGDFPVVLDPTVITSSSSAVFGVPGSTITDGYMYVGNPKISCTSDQRWRSTALFDYWTGDNNLLGRHVTAASLSTTTTGASSGTQAYNVYWAEQWGAHMSANPRLANGAGVFGWTNPGTLNSPSTWNSYGSGTMGVSSTTTTSSPALAQLYDYFTTSRYDNGVLLFVGNEASCTYSVKKFTAQLSLTTFAGPGMSELSTPEEGVTLITDTPTLTSTAATDPGGAAVYYKYRVLPASGSQARSGTLLESGWLAAPQWAVPSGLITGQPYSWTVETATAAMIAAGTVGVRSGSQTFLLSRRLGTSSPSPSQPAGPVTVNLATGNVATAVSLPGFSTVAGGVGAVLTYNSQDTTTDGLDTLWYTDGNGDGQYTAGSSDVLYVDTVESVPAFDVGLGSRYPGVPADSASAVWTGYLTVPVTGSWSFGAVHDNKLKAVVNGTTALNLTSGAPASQTDWSSTAVTLTRGVSYPVTVSYSGTTGSAYAALKARIGTTEYQIDSSWFSPQARSVPRGWQLAGVSSAAQQYKRAIINPNAIVLFTGDDETVTFTNSATSYSREWASPAGIDDTLAVDGLGNYVVTSPSGTITIFDSGGNLTSVSALADTSNNFSPTRTLSGTPTKLTAITDPVSSRALTLAYGGGACTTPPSGFAAAPTGMLCRVVRPDGSASDVFYDANGLLARVVAPGGATTDYTYTNGSLTAVLSPNVYDAITAGVNGGNGTTAIPNDLTARTVIAYDSNGRATSVTAPNPTPWIAGTPRPQMLIDYNSARRTQVRLAGFYSDVNLVQRDVTFDDSGRALDDTDPANIKATTTWDAKVDDRVLAGRDPQGFASTTYDTDGNGVRTLATTSYGPSSPTCFNMANRTPNGTCSNPAVPSTTTVYDTTQGLLRTGWSNATWSGRPDAALTTGTNGLASDWNTSGPTGLSTDNFSLRYTGWINLPTPTNCTAEFCDYTFTLNADDRAWLMIDSGLVVSNQSANIARSETLSFAPGWHRIRVDMVENSGSAMLQLQWAFAGTATTDIPNTAYSPGYMLPTSITTDDDSTASPDTVQTVAYNGGGVDPLYGLATSTTVGALTTTNTYEAVGTGYMRQLTKTLPGGNTTSYAYYGATTTVDNPCTTVVDPVSQAGLLKTVTSPNNSGGLTLVEETVYDLLGRPVATRKRSSTAEPWTCTTYDARGRVSKTVYPANAFYPARTVTTGYAGANATTTGNPRIVEVSDTAGTVETEVDLLGRPVSGTDVWGKTVLTEYDQVGRPMQVTTPAGLFVYGYNSYGQLSSVLLDWVSLANGFVYDTAGRLSAVSYPLAGARLAPVVHDSNGNVTGLDFQTSAGVSFSSSTVTRAASGRVLTASANGSLLWSYGYDAAGRLVSASGSGHSYAYDFTTAVSGCPTGANTNAGKNTNRSRLIDNGVAVSSYCYDMADRQIAASGIAYDSHQNQVLHDGDTYRYDQADRHLTTLVAGVRQVTLARDALDRIVARTDTDLATNTTSTTRYGFAGAGDLVSAVYDTANNLIETTVALPGGVLYTKRAGTSTDVWSYPNTHGDVAATRVNSTVTAFNWDPYGNPVGAVPDNSAGTVDWGWLGQHQRTLDHPSGLNPVIEMGTRVYQPDTGRFQQTDPIEDGTTTNPYGYVPDPINQYDLDGLCKKHKGFSGWWRDRACGIGDGTKALGKGLLEGLENDYMYLVSGANFLNRKILCPTSRNVSYLDLRGRTVSAGTWLPSRWFTAITRNQSKPARVWSKTSWQASAIGTVGDLACRAVGA